MKKTSLYIDPEVDRALQRRAVKEGITKAELVRHVLAATVSGRGLIPWRAGFSISTSPPSSNVSKAVTSAAHL